MRCAGDGRVLLLWDTLYCIRTPWMSLHFENLITRNSCYTIPVSELLQSTKSVLEVSVVSEPRCRAQ